MYVRENVKMEAKMANISYQLENWGLINFGGETMMLKDPKFPRILRTVHH